ncbi:MAG: hypothetical protein NZ610_05750 [Candidatus Bipolaricaulota bacterium]|nr:hypothetical protein [Candidatus Bipolaricaulota bacterium]MCS7274885.1 hypothetical protein [Candidatus Bipolaricaulota bacterium]MDW8111164.1 hypothetical protein [Candidatus Bipolaricaulota bacterium]
MSESVYRSQAPFAERESAVLVIACTSNAFLPYTREFLERHLGLPEGSYDLLAVPGGGQFLLLTEYLPKFAWVGHRWIKFLVERHRLRRVIVIAHQDCAWYSEERFIPPFLQRLGVGRSLKDRQREDLREIVQALRQLSLPIAIEAYYAEKSADGFVRFTKEA